MKKKELYGMDLNQIQDILSPYPSYRAKQLYEFMYHRRGVPVGDFSQCSVFPISLRNELACNYFLSSLHLENVLTASDGSKKFSFLLHDKTLIESVALFDKQKRVTACVSSQVGCKMGCAFCQTARLGFTRNLSAGEILEQISIIEAQVGLIDNIVFMGMGEPLDNFKQVSKALSILIDPMGFNFGQRRITVSTSGIIEGIEHLANLNTQIRLAVSLNSALQEKRISIMPIGKNNTLKKLHRALKAYQLSTNNRRITLEYVCLDNFNLFKEDSEAIVQFCDGLNVLINLIPFNPSNELSFQRPKDKTILNFAHTLTERGLRVTIRNSKGQEVLGACGQLAALHVKQLSGEQQ